ncbi:MAG TPA: lipocalin-like domain-containing protein [Ktedonobacterales bacterium]|nr:lipocalin-like domain-containing protein [Ktedonobacterales bacterium]
MADVRFSGTWRLVSFESRAEDGTVSYPFGPDARGYIIYGADGYMAVVLQPAERRQFAKNDYQGGTLEERAAAGEHFISYAGRFEVVPGDTVVHHVEVSFFPNWIGTAQQRLFHFQGNQLMLSTRPMQVAGRIVTSQLIWERVG